MGLSTKEKWGLGLLGTAALVGLAAALSKGGGSGDRTSRDEDEDDLLPPGRSHELNVLAAMDRLYPRQEVLDNATFDLGDGSRIRPDVVVMDRHDQPLEVREAKDVAELRSGHVLQAHGYDEALEPEYGTTVDIAADTHVPDHVADLADALGIGVTRRG